MPEFVTFEGHSDRLMDVAWLPDGKLATASFDGSIRIWDNAGKQVRIISSRTELLYAISVSSDGKWLASGGKGQLVRLWSLSAEEASTDLNYSFKSTFRLAFSPDSKWLAAVGEDEPRVYLCEIANPKAPKIINCEDPDDKNQRRSYFALAFSGDSKQLVAGGIDRTLRLIGVEIAKEIRRFDAVEYSVFKEKDKKINREQRKGASNFTVYAAAFSRDGKWVASGGLDNVIRVWDCESGELKQTFEARAGYIQRLEFLPRGDLLFACLHNGVLQLCNYATGKDYWTKMLPTLTQSGVISPDGTKAAVAGMDAKAYVVPLPV